MKCAEHCSAGRNEAHNHPKGRRRCLSQPAACIAIFTVWGCHAPPRGVFSFRLVSSVAMFGVHFSLVRRLIGLVTDLSWSDASNPDNPSDPISDAHLAGARG